MPAYPHSLATVGGHVGRLRLQHAMKEARRNMHARQKTAEQRYGSASQCAEYLGGSESWFLTHVAPHIHAVGVGNRRVFSFMEIDAWWGAQASGGGDPTDGTVRPPGRRGGRPRRVVG